MFEKYVKDGVPVLCICLNAAFSGSIQSAMNAKNQILEDYPEAQIEVVDSEEVTALQGMFVEEACRLRGIAASSTGTFPMPNATVEDDARISALLTREGLR